MVPCAFTLMITCTFKGSVERSLLPSKQLQSCKKVQEKSRDIACKTKFFPPYVRQVAKIYVETSHNVVWLETIEITKQRTAFIWCFAQEVDECLKDCDKQRLQTTVSINLWKIFAGHTGDWFDVRTASICTTDLWDAPKSFILNNLKFKVAPYPIIVSLDTLRGAWRDHCFPEPFSWFLHKTCLESLKITSVCCFLLKCQRKDSKKAKEHRQFRGVLGRWRTAAIDRNFSCLWALSKNGRFRCFFSDLGCHLANKSLSWPAMPVSNKKQEFEQWKRIKLFDDFWVRAYRFDFAPRRRPRARSM